MRKLRKWRDEKGSEEVALRFIGFRGDVLTIRGSLTDVNALSNGTEAFALWDSDASGAWVFFEDDSGIYRSSHGDRIVVEIVYEVN